MTASSGTAPDADYVYEALLRYNYLPMVREQRDETPPLFSTEGLSTALGDRLANHCSKLDERRKQCGFDQVEYNATRFTNVRRRMHIPHPTPYARLCRHIHDHWKDICYICDNERSQIRPQKHADGRVYTMGSYDLLPDMRVIIMEADTFPDDVMLHLNLSHGATYAVHADISSCFPSIYSHAIPWALIGHSRAKSQRSSTLWYNQLDKYQRFLKRNETLGVPIGPATSNIIAEIILANVDCTLANSHYRFVRFIDDYTCYCENQSHADKFLRDLEHELGLFNLTLNARKVSIEPLPTPTRSSWVTQIAGLIPSTDDISPYSVRNLLDSAVHMQRLTPDGSVLKYVARAIASKLSFTAAQLFCKYLIQLAFHYPIVLPILCDVVHRHQVLLNIDDILIVLSKQLLARRSDMVCWTLYLLAISSGGLTEDIADRIVNAGDCMAMAAMIATGQHQNKVCDFIEHHVWHELYDQDQYWLLIHELVLRGSCDKDSTPMEYWEASGLRILGSDDISFLVPPDSITRS